MLIEKGITPSEDTSDNTDSEKWYEGNWLGEDAYIVVNTTPVSGTVFGVSITLVDVRDEDGNMEIANKIDKLVKSKYNVVETKEDKGRTAYKMDDGVIGVTIEEGVLSVHYIDLENCSLADDEEDI